MRVRQRVARVHLQQLILLYESLSSVDTCMSPADSFDTETATDLGDLSLCVYRQHTVH